MPKLVSMPDEDSLQAPVAMPASDAREQWWERRERFRGGLRQRPPSGLSSDEIEMHFSAMPAHYWEHVSESELLWGLQTVHGFLNLIASPHVPATAPFVDCRDLPEGRGSQIMLCTWDRHGLLAKSAAALSAVRLNILRADVFTRADDIVLDRFTVMDSDGHQAATAKRMEEMTFLLEGALSEPPRFASVWACSRHKYLAPPGRFPPRIEFDNQSSPTSTIIGVEAADRLGLLYDILQAVADHGLGISHASIKTDNDRAHDQIHVTGSQGQKLTEPHALEELRRSLEAAIGSQTE